MSTKTTLINEMKQQSESLQKQADAARLAGDGALYTSLIHEYGSIENEILTLRNHTEEEIELYLKHDMI